ncbi:hypothetical protein [Microterricola viridarii]|uniref:Uncharacterized protein n=1 Tax=Microterricola viridarii TaxID=412690 RepID=A0A120I0Y2_9MICO|nr:hypothetical protein [Microterricola viridarii]AMB58023.1 hypothetical protein AWU67_03115 [Microterricola viridarii]
MFFEQFPGQRSVRAEVARTILLFGSACEHPPTFAPEAMKPGWFEAISDGLSLDEYVESIFLISVGAQNSSGAFTPSWLDGPGFKGLDEVISFEAVRRTFSEHLVVSASSFKVVNLRFRGSVPSTQKKFAFNPLTDTPFIEGIAALPIAPWCQAAIAKATPPAIYHLGVRALDAGFTNDLGHVFQHYVGRQLELINGERSILPEVRYGPKKSSVDSCDWFLDLPGLLVMIECKARQPIESLRTGGTDWLRSVEDSIGKGIAQLNRSNSAIERIGSTDPRIDTTKRRVGIVVTLEPFYVDQNWLIRDQLAVSEFPVGAASIMEMEMLAMLSADELANALSDAAASSEGGVMLLSLALDAAAGRENPLLVSTWESIPLFARVEAAATRLRAEVSDRG